MNKFPEQRLQGGRRPALVQEDVTYKCLRTLSTDYRYIPLYLMVLTDM